MKVKTPPGTENRGPVDLTKEDGVHHEDHWELGVLGMKCIRSVTDIKKNSVRQIHTFDV